MARAHELARQVQKRFDELFGKNGTVFLKAVRPERASLKKLASQTLTGIKTKLENLTNWKK